MGNIDATMNDLEVVRVDDHAAAHDISLLQRSIEETAADRARLANEVAIIQDRMAHGHMAIGREQIDLRGELARNKALLGIKVIVNAIKKAVRAR